MLLPRLTFDLYTDHELIQAVVGLINIHTPVLFICHCFLLLCIPTLTQTHNHPAALTAVARDNWSAIAASVRLNSL